MLPLQLRPFTSAPDVGNGPQSPGNHYILGSVDLREYPFLHKYRDTTWENGYNESFNGKLRDELLNGEIFCSLAEAAVLVEQWRREYNTVRPHSACGGFPPAPEAIKPSPWFLRMPVLHGPPQVLGLT